MQHDFTGDKDNQIARIPVATWLSFLVIFLQLSDGVCFNWPTKMQEAGEAELTIVQDQMRNF